jgi:hypothetical protein
MNYYSVVTYRREGTEVYAVREPATGASNFNTIVTLDDRTDESSSPTTNNNQLNGEDELQVCLTLVDILSHTHTCL